VLLAALTGRLTRYEIAEDSMLPTLRASDWVFAVKRPRTIGPGMVVVFEMRPGFEVVKRVAPPPPGVEGLWLLGDNAEAGSVDSRTLGPIEPERVTGRLLLRYRPGPFTAV